METGSYAGSLEKVLWGLMPRSWTSGLCEESGSSDEVQQIWEAAWSSANSVHLLKGCFTKEKLNSWALKPPNSRHSGRFVATASFDLVPWLMLANNTIMTNQDIYCHITDSNNQVWGLHASSLLGPARYLSVHRYSVFGFGCLAQFSPRTDEVRTEAAYFSGQFCWNLTMFPE